MTVSDRVSMGRALLMRSKIVLAACESGFTAGRSLASAPGHMSKPEPRNTPHQSVAFQRHGGK